MKNKRPAAEKPDATSAVSRPEQSGSDSSQLSSLLVQGWISVAVWMTVGLLLEGLIGFKTPAYLQDDQRRELFRLAHTHGTLLGLLLVLAAVCCQRFNSALPAPASIALRMGTILIPFGFMLGGLWHFESDPGVGIWLVPPGAVLVIFGVTALAFATRSTRANRD